MEMVDLIIKVPKTYIEDAADFGMLDPDTLMRVLRDELDERIMQFVDAEVKAYRAEQRAQQTQDETA